jgi:hypothetical protein
VPNPGIRSRRPRLGFAVLAAGLLATAAHAQGKPGARPDVLTNPAAVYSVPAASLPVYLKTFTDPTFGTNVMRIAPDAGNSTSPVSGSWGTDSRHHYSKDEPWSADGAFYSLENRGGGSPTPLILDGHTFKPLFSVPAGGGLYDYRWHPSLAHAHEFINVSSSGTELSWVDAATGAKTRTWTLPIAVSGFGQGEGNASVDGRYVALGNGTRMIVVDMDPQPPYAPYPNRRIGPAVDVSSCGLSGCAIDWVSISASGKYAVVNYDGDHPRVFEVNPATLALSPHPEAGGSPRCSGTAAGGFVYDVGHADLALNPFDNNADVMIGQEHCGNHGATIGGKAVGYVLMVRLSDGAITPLTSPANEAYPHHVSTRNIRLPGWAFVSHYKQAGTRFSDEIMAVKLDGSLACMRFIHAHSAFSGCYRCEVHPVPSPDGSMVAFASNWAQDCGSGCGSSSVIKDYVISTGVAVTDAGDPPRPAAGALTLARIWPNPTALPLHVSYALPASTPARLELVDVAGRSVLAQELGAPGAGAFEASLGESGSLRPGTYWLRLSQGREHAVSRVVILH